MHFIKSARSLRSRKSHSEEGHGLRKLSIGSTSSQSSTDSTVSSPSSTKSGVNPLASHPPLSLNESPRIVDDEDLCREDRFFNPRHHALDHIMNSPEYSPVKGDNCYFSRDIRGNRRDLSYIYDRQVQWPLRDWQCVPPGLAPAGAPIAGYPAGTSEDDMVATSLSPRPATHYSSNSLTELQRRPTEWMDEADAFVKRGSWKRRGIVFYPDLKVDEEDEFDLSS